MRVYFIFIPFYAKRAISLFCKEIGLTFKGFFIFFACYFYFIVVIVYQETFIQNKIIILLLVLYGIFLILTAIFTPGVFQQIILYIYISRIIIVMVIYTPIVVTYFLDVN